MLSITKNWKKYVKNFHATCVTTHTLYTFRHIDISTYFTRMLRKKLIHLLHLYVKVVNALSFVTATMTYTTTTKTTMTTTTTISSTLTKTTNIVNTDDYYCFSYVIHLRSGYSIRVINLTPSYVMYVSSSKLTFFS